jgi:hypothetical protein
MGALLGGGDPRDFDLVVDHRAHLEFRQGLVEVGEDILDVLDADGVADQVVGDAQLTAFVRVGRGKDGLLADDALHAAEGRPHVGEAKAIDELAGFLQAASDIEADDAAEAAHLAAGDGVIRMAGEPGVVDASDRRMSLEMLGNALGALVLAPDAEIKGLEPAQ